MKEKKKVPELRFKGFEGEWISEKLGSITNWSSGGTPPKDKIEYWQGTIPWISASTMRGNEYYDSDLYISNEGLKNGSRLAKKDSLLLLVRGSMLFKKIPIGIALNDLAFNQDVKAIEVSENLLPRFLLHWFGSSEDKLLSLVTGTGIGAGKLDLQELKSFEINLPSYAEQQKIASFLTAIDEKLQALKKKKSLLEEYKKGVMQQIFSQELRFKDEDGKDFPDWEEKRLGEIGTVIRGASPRPQGDKRYYGGNVPRLMVADVTRDGKYVTPKVDYLTIEGAKLSRPCPAGTLTIVCSGTVGIPSILAVDACIHDGFLALIDIDSTASVDFLYHILSTLRDKFESSATHGGVFTNLTTATLKEFPVSFPTINEQVRIAKYLSELDQKINHYNQKIDKMGNWKKGLLQKMFV